MVGNLEKKEIREILKNNYLGRLGFCLNGRPYIIPTTYYFDNSTSGIVSHSREGMKIEAMRKNPEICFEIEEVDHLSKWRSVLLWGKYEELTGSTARHALHSFVEHIRQLLNKEGVDTAHFINDLSYAESGDGAAVIYRIHILGQSGKYGSHDSHPNYTELSNSN